MDFHKYIDNIKNDNKSRFFFLLTCYEMRISDPQLSPNILAKCSTMSEHRLLGIKENDRTIKEEVQKPNYGQGGRLKFFKGQLK